MNRFKNVPPAKCAGVLDAAAAGIAVRDSSGASINRVGGALPGWLTFPEPGRAFGPSMLKRTRPGDFPDRCLAQPQLTVGLNAAKVPDGFSRCTQTCRS